MNNRANIKNKKIDMVTDSPSYEIGQNISGYYEGRDITGKVVDQEDEFMVIEVDNDLYTVDKKEFSPKSVNESINNDIKIDDIVVVTGLGKVGQVMLVPEGGQYLYEIRHMDGSKDKYTSDKLKKISVDKPSDDQVYRDVMSESRKFIRLDGDDVYILDDGKLVVTDIMDDEFINAVLISPLISDDEDHNILPQEMKMIKGSSPVNESLISINESRSRGVFDHFLDNIKSEMPISGFSDEFMKKYDDISEIIISKYPHMASAEDPLEDRTFYAEFSELLEELLHESHINPQTKILE